MQDGIEKNKTSKIEGPITYLVSCWRQASSPGVHLVVSVASQFVTKYAAVATIIVNKKKLFPLSINIMKIAVLKRGFFYNGGIN